MINLATIVEETETITRLPTWDLVRWRSVRIVGIKGARPNHPKKHTKNISQVIWKLRIWTPLKLNIFNLVSGFIFEITGMEYFYFVEMIMRRQAVTYIISSIKKWVLC
jgi:Na+/melibiose symporter-like transporter